MVLTGEMFIFPFVRAAELANTSVLLALVAGNLLPPQAGAIQRTALALAQAKAARHAQQSPSSSWQLARGAAEDFERFGEHAQLIRRLVRCNARQIRVANLLCGRISLQRNSGVSLASERGGSVSGGKRRGERIFNSGNVWESLFKRRLR